MLFLAPKAEGTFNLPAHTHHFGLSLRIIGNE
jgi:hypothetical protein